MAAFATVAQYEGIYGAVPSADQEKITLLLTIASDKIRQAGLNVGKDVDGLVTDGKILSTVLQEVTCRIVKEFVSRIDDLSTMGMSQVTQSALGYSFTGTYSVPGGGLSVMKKDLSILGLRRQTMGVINLCQESEE